MNTFLEFCEKPDFYTIEQRDEILQKFVELVNRFYKNNMFTVYENFIKSSTRIWSKITDLNIALFIYSNSNLPLIPERLFSENNINHMETIDSIEYNSNLMLSKPIVLNFLNNRELLVLYILWSPTFTPISLQKTLLFLKSTFDVGVTDEIIRMFGLDTPTPINKKIIIDEVLHKLNYVSQNITNAQIMFDEDDSLFRWSRIMDYFNRMLEGYAQIPFFNVEQRNLLNEIRNREWASSEFYKSQIMGIFDHAALTQIPVGQVAIPAEAAVVVPAEEEGGGGGGTSGGLNFFFF
jgi:hypothetical protein